MKLRLIILIAAILSCFPALAQPLDPTGNPQCVPCATNDPVYRIAGSGLRMTNMQQVTKLLFSNYESRPIFLARFKNLPNEWLLLLSGLQLEFPKQMTGLEEVRNALQKQPSKYSQLIIRAMAELNVPPEAHVYVVGHSLGGFEAENLEFNQAWHGADGKRWDLTWIATVGAPALHIEIEDIRRFLIQTDPIPFLCRRLDPFATSTWGDNFAIVLRRMSIIDDGGRNILQDPHSGYPDSYQLRDVFDAWGNPTGRTNDPAIVLDPQEIYRASAWGSLVNEPINSSGLGSLMLCDPRNQYTVIYRNMKMGGFPDGDPKKGASNANSKGARTRQSNPNFPDINPVGMNQMVGPHYTKQDGLSANLKHRELRSDQAEGKVTIAAVLAAGQGKLAAVNDHDTHVCIFPAYDMTFAEFQSALNAITWQ